MQFDRTAADFFAGIGLVSLGLQRAGWRTLYAVDYSPEKQRIYESHFGGDHYRLQNVKFVHGKDVPLVTLAHASFPCTDLSVAGARRGIDSGESSSFWEFIRIIREMGTAELQGLPPLVLLENVEGLLTSNGGKDLVAILMTLNELGYEVDLLLIDATHFVPQSRVRLFVVAVAASLGLYRLGLGRLSALATSNARPAKLRHFIEAHPEVQWYLRPLPNLPHRTMILGDIVDIAEPWWDHERAAYLLSQMFDRHRDRLELLKQNDFWTYGTAFRRMRIRDGTKQSTAEIRLDGIAGCLRTPKGGSARQILIRVGHGSFNARLLSAKENARLMGADEFCLPPDLSLNDALFGFGDAVCVPVIEWIAVNYLDPVLDELTISNSGEQLSTFAGTAVSDIQLTIERGR